MRPPLKAVFFLAIFLTPVFLLAQPVSSAGQNYLAAVEKAQQAIAADQWNQKAYTALRIALLDMKEAREKGVAGVPDPGPYWERLFQTYPNNICAQSNSPWWKPYRTADELRKRLEPVLVAHSEPRGNQCAADAARNLAMAFADEGEYEIAKNYRIRQKALDPKDPFIDGYIKEMSDKAFTKTLKSAEVKAAKASVGTKRIVRENGDIYTGPVDRLDRPMGKGKLEMKNGNVYEGNFFDGEMTGYGVFRFASGKVYEGEILKGIMHGKGRYNMIVSVYTGDFFRGNMTGKGKLVMLDGATKGDEYEGEFVKGKPHGWGTYTESRSGKSVNAGRTITGTWENGKLIKSMKY